MPEATVGESRLRRHSPRAGGAGVLGGIPGRAPFCLERIIGWILAAALGASVGQSQFRPVDYRVDADEEKRAAAEYERRRQLEAAYAARRARAHARLGTEAGSTEPRLHCPALVGPSLDAERRGKSGSRPLVARYAPRPAGLRWRGTAPASESPSVLFSEHISGPVVQSKCVNCHIEGGVSGHTRLVLSPADPEGHEALNLAVFQAFLAAVEDAADLILNKIQGVGHGGGIQVPAGSADFANMERFLRLLGGETSSGSLSPETLFDGVTMASPARALRRAALIFAGRLPTQEEVNSVNDGEESSLRRAIRNLMTGPGFHEFLVRASNDRLLTDREANDGVIDLDGQNKFIALANKHWEMATAALDRGYERPWRDPAYSQWTRALYHGLQRAPLELIARVVENDLPYTEILTADYIMANPAAAEGYGAATEFENADSALEFQPSEIASYYRDDESKVGEFVQPMGFRVDSPGNLATDYPHAGILNTTVFLLRYPTTATNRNRARARWTYYHFLGLDVEKSASRTTDPDALADTDNPTMKNAACTVCHSVLDPVAGAFQNYGDRGLYRDQWRGLDSLAKLYKRPQDGSVSPYQVADTWYGDMREPGFGDAIAPSADNSLQWLAEQIAEDRRFAEAAVKFWWPAILGVEVAAPPEDRGDSDFEAQLVAATAQSVEVSRLADAFRSGIAGGKPYNARDLLAEIALSPWFRAESVTGQDPVRDAALRNAGIARLLTPEELDRKTEAVSGYVWGRQFMQPFGAGRARTSLNDFEGRESYGLLYGGIDSDGIAKRAREMTPLMLAVAQAHAAEVSCPIAFREFFVWPDESRRLFGGIDRTVSPISEAYGSAAVEAESWEARETNAITVSLSAGTKTVRLRYPNNFWNPETRVTRNLIVDEVVVRDAAGSVVAHVELESLDPVDLDVDSPTVQGGCDGWPYYNGTLQRDDGYELNYCRGWLDVPVLIPAGGEYRIEVVAFQKAAGDEPAMLEISVESDSESSRGALAIRRKLVDLHERLLGVTVGLDSPDVDAAFGLFVDVWNRARQEEGGNFGDSQLGCATSGDHRFYEGLVDDAVHYDKWGNSQVDWDRRGDFHDGLDTSDTSHSVRAWVVTLAYLLTDYRYLHF